MARKAAISTVLQRRSDWFTRFSVNELHKESGQPLGIFHAVRYLRDDGKLTRAQERVANEVFDWMSDHLNAPKKSSLTSHPKAISWFRSAAARHLLMTRRLTPILKAHGYRVDVKRTTNPGTIVYKDDIQVFAIQLKAT